MRAQSWAGAARAMEERPPVLKVGTVRPKGQQRTRGPGGEPRLNNAEQKAASPRAPHAGSSASILEVRLSRPPNQWKPLATSQAKRVRDGENQQVWLSRPARRGAPWPHAGTDGSSNRRPARISERRPPLSIRTVEQLRVRAAEHRHTAETSRGAGSRLAAAAAGGLD